MAQRAWAWSVFPQGYRPQNAHPALDAPGSNTRLSPVVHCCLLLRRT